MGSGIGNTEAILYNVVYLMIVMFSKCSGGEVSKESCQL